MEASDETAVPLALTLPFLIALLTGCSKPGNPEQPVHRSRRRGERRAGRCGRDAAPPILPYVGRRGLGAVRPDLDRVLSASPAGASLRASSAAAVRPLTFWRQIRSVERRFEFAFADTDSTGRPTTCVVTVHQHILGTFNLLVGDDVPEGNLPRRT